MSHHGSAASRSHLRQTLLNAILSNQKISGGHCVLDGEGEAVPLKREDFEPPYLVGSALRYARQEDDEGARTLRRFEDLSLAVRMRCLRIAPSDAGLAWEGRLDEFPVIPAALVVEAIAAAAAKFDAQPDLKHEAGPGRERAGRRRQEDPSIDQLRRVGVQRHKARRGLQIVGCQIEGDIDLVNARLPFSVRLIGCAIRGNIIADHCDLMTLDLSGSSVRGVYATFMNARGSVRMRRTVVSGPVDFGGARVAGVFDASDSVVLPFEDAPPTEAFVGDRGVFNLSLATLENEVRMTRTRIYGGLSVRGCVVNRTVFMDDAILRSPVAVLEKLAADAIMRQTSVSLPAPLIAHARAEDDLAARLHPSRSGRDASAKDEKRSSEEKRLRLRRQELEKLAGHAFMRAEEGASGERLLQLPRTLERLLGESIRARTCALRADGWVIKGSLFARGLRAGGRVRLKYAHIGGGLHLDGARLRSTEAIRAGLECIDEACVANPCPEAAAALRVWKETRKHADQNEARRNDDRALDMRHITIDGDLRIWSDARKRRMGVGDAALLAHLRTLPGVEEALQGNAAASREKLDAAPNGDGDVDPHDDGSAKNGVYLGNALIAGRLSAAGATIAGSFHLNGVIANAFPGASPLSGDFLDIRKVEVGESIDFRWSVGIAGVNALGARVALDVLFADPPTFVEQRSEWAPLTGRAVLLSGDVALARAKVGGECVVVFDKEAGPGLRLGQSVFEGRLQILPATGLLEWDEREALGRLDRLTQGIGKIRSRLYPERGPVIDLRNTRASVFGHPPTAWPKVGQLSIAGFEYGRARDHGPLAPVRISFDQIRRNREQNQESFARWLQAAMLWVGGLIVAVFAISRRPDEAAFFSGIFTKMFNTFGAANLLLLSALLLLLWFKRNLLGERSEPTNKRSLPMGELWLKHQRFRLSVLRTKNSIIPLEPYLQASRALRAAGRIQSANWIEFKRMQERAHVLSWRHHFPAKAFLYAVDLFTMYGFGVARASGWAAGAILLAAMTFHQADACRLMQPASDNVMAQVFAPQPPTTTRTQQATRFGDVGAEVGDFPAAHVRAPFPAFNSLAYAADIFVPVLDLGQESRWTPASRLEGDQGARQWCAAPKLGARWFLLAQYLFQIFGWLLATAIAVAVITRAETIIARSSE